MLVVIALGNNALLKRGQPLDPRLQRENVAAAAAIVAAIAARHKVVVTHGNAPQLGMLAQQAEAVARNGPYPLDLLGAEAEGMIGYLIEQELRSSLPRRQVVTLLTQIEVKADDPAFRQPSAPIGTAYSPELAQRFIRERGWRMIADGAHWRRVVAMPEPMRILEMPAIRLLVTAGALVICAGGGGIPVVINEAGAVRGVEAFIDKDLAAALLAHHLKADALLMLTDVEAVERHHAGRNPTPFGETTPEELRQHRFAPESIGPKVEAACRFVEAGGGLAGIGRLEDAPAILEGLRGTIVRRGGITLDFLPAAPENR